jgi:hypothetical protein
MHPDLHAQHDPLVVAAAADRAGFLPPELADCPDCRALHADLLALAAATPGSAVPARPRPYTLSAADADRLRRPSWRRWFASIGSTRDTLSRPLAYGLTTLGLVGLLLTAGPNLMPSGAATQILAPVGPDVVESAAAAPGVGGTTNRDVTAGAPALEQAIASDAPSAADAAGGGDVERPIPDAGDSASALNEREPGAFGTTVIPALSSALVVIGLALFGLRHLRRVDRSGG